MGLGFHVKQQLKMLSQNVYLPAVYDLHRSDRIEPGLVVFADAHHDRRPEAMELLYRMLKKAEAPSEGTQLSERAKLSEGTQLSERAKTPEGTQLSERAKPPEGVRPPEGTKSPAGTPPPVGLRVCQMYLDFGKASTKQILDFSTRFMKVYARASVVVICDNFLPVASCRKKPGTLVIQLWHGCGCYKKFGYDARDDIPEGYKGEVFRNMDLVTVSAEAAVGPFCSAMHKLPADAGAGNPAGVTSHAEPEDHSDAGAGNPAGLESSGFRKMDGEAAESQPGYVRALGVSRTDLYFSEKWREKCREQFRQKYPEAVGKKVVLWAPTFRGNAGVPELLDLDVARLQEELGENYLVLTRLHPHMKEAQKAQSHSCPIPTEQLYPVVDVLIGDYSSLIYEYLLVSKLRRQDMEEKQTKLPGGLVLYVPDLDAYERQRGFYMDIRELPGQVVQSEEKLADAVRKAAEPDAAGVKKAERDTFLDRYMSACDGHATERIADEIRKHCGF